MYCVLMPRLVNGESLYLNKMAGLLLRYIPTEGVRMNMAKAHVLASVSDTKLFEEADDRLVILAGGRHEIQALVINKTLRSGQKVVHDGSVVVIGDVNPGAEVIAGEDIIVLGSCRGIAHAGASGNKAATITACKLLAAQLRIAGLIARSPDDLDQPAYAETARVHDGVVVIEPANR